MLLHRGCSGGCCNTAELFGVPVSCVSRQVLIGAVCAGQVQDSCSLSYIRPSSGKVGEQPARSKQLHFGDLPSAGAYLCAMW